MACCAAIAVWLVAGVCALGCGSSSAAAEVQPEPQGASAPVAPASRSSAPSTSDTPPPPPAPADDTPVVSGAAAAPSADSGGAGADTAVTPEPTSATRAPDPAALREAIRVVRRMPSDRTLARRARAHRMNVVNLTWEDTGRWLGSSVGPNISDLTLEVIDRSGRRPRTSLLPVLRYPNFTDRTADVPVENVMVRVGNAREGERLETVPLMEVLTHLRDYLSAPDALRAATDDFTARRDSHFLVSAQYVFVPVPDGARVEFAPVLFNYESSPGAPADLVLLATREGTSIQVIENRPDALIPGGWGQHLYFNHAGQRTTFTAERRSDVLERVESGHAEASDATALDPGADVLMIIQVPLRMPEIPRRAAAMSAPMAGMDELGGYGGGGSSGASASRARASDVEEVVIGHGLDGGAMRESSRVRIRRDARFPIRVTLQFYRATSNGVVSDEDMEAAAAQIERVYADADYVGSLVVGSQARPTSWVRP
jgi:hypothetical protein